MKRRAMYFLAFGLIVLAFVVYPSIIYKCVLTYDFEDNSEDPLIEESSVEKSYEFEKTEYEWGIVFKEVNTGEEFQFVYDEPIEEPETLALSAESSYHILELPLEQDSEGRSTREICESIGALYNFDSEILMAMCIQESVCDPEAFNGEDAGIVQVNEKWHKDRMKRLGVTDLHDPYSNVLVATDFLAELSEYASKREDVNGDIRYVLMRYNMRIDSAEDMWAQGITSDYANDVIRIAEELKYELGRE